MRLLDRWDRHNQRVMDRDRLRDLGAWTMPAIVAAAWGAMGVADWVLPWPPAVAAAWAIILTVAVVALRRAWHRRRALAQRVDAARGGSPGPTPPPSTRSPARRD